MRKEERASIVRIIADLIKADGIIDTREIDFLDVLRKKYGIKREDDRLAYTYTFAKAIEVIAAFDRSVKHSLMNDFYGVAISDRFCAKEEALILLGLRLSLSLSTHTQHWATKHPLYPSKRLKYILIINK